MVTYKYLEVRREIYNKCSDKELNSFRSFRQMLKVWNRSYWASLIGMLFCLVTEIVLSIILQNKLWGMIPLGVEMVLLVVIEVRSDKMYNPPERKKELDDDKKKYEKYVENIKKTLDACGIRTSRLRVILREECVAELEKYNKSYSFISDHVIEMFIGVPLGALISSLIFIDKQAVVDHIAVLVMLGVMIIVFIKVAKKMAFFWNGYFKDQYLLKALKELEYCEEGEERD